MSNSTSCLNSPQLSVKTQLSEKIRQQVDDRHWQLFETRLKNSLTKNHNENYTKTNDYGLVNCWTKIDQLQLPIEPNQRWQTFCSQLTTKSNETNRIMSIFHNVWINDWNRTQKSHLNTNENTFLKHSTLNEHDKKVISSILHKNI
ncbi:unnamed protein product [Rotaria sordida]|uniref:Uncharacterized protein n=1 Tax=Rotaria sordida TaxID=392033 RepID=A0A818UFC2_9BILA|nr:unnamed protein product [Rotaria sordida]CAF0793582.1 unnamed protein product [Rotaria sordida]CAF0974222.1 unnamed protein product [Rotaria sordida]CAF3699791.1 unnamed protein product [Rotaria sordida]